MIFYPHLARERRIYPTLANYAQLTEAIAHYRGITTASVKTMDAGVFFGQHSIICKLADRLETPHTAMSRIAAQTRRKSAVLDAGHSHRIAPRATAIAMQNQL